MSECIIGHDYAVIYDLEILPEYPEKLAERHENEVKMGRSLDESKKWFNDELQVGSNRPLLRDFLELAKQNENGADAASICFLVSLNKYNESLSNCLNSTDTNKTACKC